MADLEKKDVQLSEEDLKEVVGGTPGAVRKYEYDTACSGFKCTQCGGSLNQHKVDGNGRGSSSIFTNVYGGWQEEWTDYQLDCNHCQYFKRILNWASGDCVKDCE